MKKERIIMENYLKIGEAAEYLNVTEDALRKWEQKNIIKPYRTAGNQRRYTKEMLDKALVGYDSKNNFPTKLTIGYCRVSSAHQKEDLQRQIDVVQTYCENQGKPFKIIQDVGSGLNYERKGFLNLIHMICQKQCDEIIVNYQDRLARFGFELIKTICDENQVKLTVINQTQVEDPNQELVDDVLSIITVFSAKLYGKQSHHNEKIIKTNKKLFTQNN